MCFLPTISFAYKIGDITGTIGSGTEESPVRCDNFSELKQALENKEIKYVNNWDNLFCSVIVGQC